MASIPTDQHPGPVGLTEAEVEEPVVHSLLEDREAPSFANDEVGPLDDHDGDEEGGVAGVLQLLAVGVSPLLAVPV